MENEKNAANSWDSKQGSKERRCKSDGDAARGNSPVFPVTEDPMKAKVKGDRPPISLTNTRGNDLQEMSKIMKEEITIENVKVLHNTIFKKLTTHPQRDGTRLRTLYINAKEDKTYFPSIKPYHPMQKTLQTRSKVMKVKRHYSKPFPRYIQASGSKCKNTSPRRPPTAKLSRI